MPRVLTVDDSRAIRMIVTKVLTELGLEVDEAEDGEKGLQRFEELEFDLVILDVTMPVLDGPGMLKRMREQGNNTPVLMLTSESKRSIVSEIMKLKIEDYILKPFKNDELKAKILKILKTNDPGIMATLAAAPTMAAANRVAEVQSMDAPTPGRQFADILVIDDMENVAKKLRSMIPAHLSQMSGLSAQAGLKLARDNTYRVILIDRELPDVPAPTLVKQLRVLQPNAACLAITLRSANNVTKEVKEEGFDDVLFKPFSQDTVDDMLQAYFQTAESLTRHEDVLTVAPFSGRAERLDRYYQRLSALVKDAVKDIAEACFESVVLDASRMTLDQSKAAQFIMDLDQVARGFGVAVTVVGPAPLKKALQAFADTKDIKVVESLKDAK